MLVVITIPIYKEAPDQLEIISLKQCFKILGAYPIIFFAPESLNISLYQKFISKDLLVERFDDKYFINIAGYNKLMLKSEFYKRFKAYDFILIYQPDAYVFRDELEYWCKTGYDYIGAPWFVGYNNALPDAEFLGIGNGGFALRKVSSHLKVLNSFSYLTPFKTTVRKFLDSGFSFKAFKQLVLDLTLQNNTYSLFNNYERNEDIFWGMLSPARFAFFKVPPMEVAAKFSFETNVKRLYLMNNHHLPFGCHAWEKYDIAFWREHICDFPESFSD